MKEIRYMLKHGIIIVVKVILFMQYLFIKVLLLKKSQKNEVLENLNVENKKVFDIEKCYEIKES